MSDAAAAPKPAKATKPKASKPKAAPTHPKYAEMVKEAITSLGERTGSSRQAIFKFIDGKYKVGEAGKSHLRIALKRGVEKKELVNPKGHGGSYRLAPAAKKEKKPKVVKPKAAKKVTKKKTSAKPKAAAKPKKTSAKKAPTKPKAAAKKPAAKKPAAKKPAAKKSPKKSTKKAAA